MVKILVTGGAGFIGSHIVDALVSRGEEVVVLDNLDNGKRENVNSKAKLIVKDIRDDLSEIFESDKFDYVFHLAAQANVRKSLENPKEDADINIIGGLNLIDNCVKFGVKKIIFSSTGGALFAPDAELPCREDGKVGPQSPYGVAKLTIENYLRIIKETKGLDFTILRYPNVYGPRQNSKGEAGVVAIFLDNLFAEKELVIFGDGEQTRDYIFVKDVVEANLMALKLSGTYHVSTGIESSVNQIVDMLIKITGKKAKVKHGEAISGEVKRNALSSDKLRREGWEPKYDFERGLRETFDWFKTKR